MRLAEAPPLQLVTATPLPVKSPTATNVPTAEMTNSSPEWARMGMKIAGALGPEGIWTITPAPSNPGEFLDNFLESAPEGIKGGCSLIKLVAKLSSCAGEGATNILWHCSPEVFEMLSCGLKLSGHEHLGTALSIGGILLEGLDGKVKDSRAVNRPLPLVLAGMGKSPEWKSSFFMSVPPTQRPERLTLWAHSNTQLGRAAKPIWCDSTVRDPYTREARISEYGQRK
jgi:hypothetical protein